MWILWESSPTNMLPPGIRNKWEPRKLIVLTWRYTQMVYLERVDKNNNVICAIYWIFVSPWKSVCWRPNPQCDGICKWCLWRVIRVRWSHNGRAHMMGSMSLQEEKETKLLSLPCENTMRKWPSPNEGVGPHPTLPLRLPSIHKCEK